MGSPDNQSALEIVLTQEECEDRQNCESLKARIIAEIAQNPSKHTIEFNVQDVSRITKTAIGVLLSCLACGIDNVAISNASDPVREKLDTVRFDEMVESLQRQRSNR